MQFYSSKPKLCSIFHLPLILCNDQILHSLPNTLNTVKQPRNRFNTLADRARFIRTKPPSGGWQTGERVILAARGVCPIYDWCQPMKGSSKSRLATEKKGGRGKGCNDAKEISATCQHPVPSGGSTSDKCCRIHGARSKRD